MGTKYDWLLPPARKLVNGIASKPGVHIADKAMLIDWVAQALNGMIERKELPPETPTGNSKEKSNG